MHRRGTYLAQNESKGDAACFGGLELILQLGLHLIEEFGLIHVSLVLALRMEEPQLTLIPASHSRVQIWLLSLSSPVNSLPPPNAMTKTSTSFLRSFFWEAWMMEKIRSMPKLIPTQGTCVFPENMPTRLSYLRQC
jgi:hypothetical protein